MAKKQANKYRWRKGSRLTGKGDANQVGRALEELRLALDGNLTPEEVLREARNKNSPLYNCFTWDDNKAAHEHRLWQARILIADVEVITVTGKPLRQFVHVQYEDGSAYTSMEHAMSDRELRAQVLQKALEDYERKRMQYEHLHELADIHAAIKKTKRKNVA